MIKKCDEHTNGKTCVQVIAEGKCHKEACSLFPKVLRFIPKLKKLKEAEAEGIILRTLWGFSEKAEMRRMKKKRKAEKWLREFYPRIEKELGIP